MSFRSLIDSQVQEQLAQCLAGNLSLREFQIWFAATAWALGREDDTTAHPLAHAVELRVAEYTSGDWSEDELRAALSALLEGTIGVGGFRRTGGWASDEMSVLIHK